MPPVSSAHGYGGTDVGSHDHVGRQAGGRCASTIDVGANHIPDLSKGPAAATGGTKDAVGGEAEGYWSCPPIVG